MADDRTVRVTLRAEVGQYAQAMRDASRATRDVGDTSERTSRQSTSAFGRMLQSAEQNRGAWEAVGRGMLAVGAATAAVGAAALKTGIEYNTLQQTSRAALTTILGSAEAANAQMDKLDEFARTSPFAKQTFIQAQQQMLAFGIETQKVIPYLDAVQEAVAAAGGSNADIEAIVATMSKIQSSSKITAEDLNEFGNRGVNAAELIGSQMGMTGAQIREGITAGTLDAEQALDALAAGMKENFDGASENVKQTFAGAMDRVKAAWRDFAAELATPLVDPNGGGALVDLLNWAADAMRAFEDLPGPLKTTATTLGGVTAAVGLLGGAFALLMPKLAVANTRLNTFAERSRGAAVAAKGIRAAAVGLPAVLGAASIAFGIWATNAAEAKAAASAFADTLDSAGNATKDTLASISDILTQDQRGWLDRLAGADFYSIASAADAMGLSVEQLSGYIQGNAADVEAVTKATQEWDASQKNVNDTEFYNRGELVIGMLDDQAEAMGVGREQAKGAADAQDELGAATDGLADSTEDSTSAMERNVEAINGQQDALDEARTAALGLRNAEVGLEQAIDDASDAIEENGKTLDITTQKGRDNQRALDNIASAGLDVVSSMRENGASQKDLQATMRRTRRRFIEAAEAAGMSSREARNLADQLGLVPKDVKPKIDVDTGNSEAKIRGVRGLINGLKDKTITLTTYSRTVFSSTGHQPTGVLRTEFGGATGGLITAAGIRGFADGGLVPGTPPSNPMADNLLATNENGTPFAIRSREYIQSQPAVDHYGVAAMAAINQRKVPKSLLQGFAAGGQVPGYAAGSAVVTTPNVTASIGDVSATIGSESMRAFAREVAQATLAAAGVAIDRRTSAQDQQSRYVTGAR